MKGQKFKDQAPRHYIVVVHGIGEQKINETIPPVVQRFAEVRHSQKSDDKKNLYGRVIEAIQQQKKQGKLNIIIPATLSSQSVRSESELHGWSEFKGIPVKPGETHEPFDGAPATETAGENFRFVEMYWQNILQSHQKQFASNLESWTKAMLERLRDKKNITPAKWLPPWADPLLESIVNVTVPLKNMLAFKYVKQVNFVVDGFLGDVHLYGDYARTRGEAVRHFHAALDKLMFYDFLDWRKRELSVSRINNKELKAASYIKPQITIIAHSLGSVMSFDALTYAYAKKAIREAASEGAEYPSSFPFFGYTQASKEEDGRWEKHKDQIKKFAAQVERRLADEAKYASKESVGADAEKYYNDFDKRKSEYWNHFLDGFQDSDDNAQPSGDLVKVFEPQTAGVRPNINEVVSSSIPLLLWRGCVKNFITLGSPIDKYIILWRQNYKHLGYNKLKEELKYENFDDEEKSVIDQYAFLPCNDEDHDERIRHFNLFDEQDPVGQQLEKGRKTEIYCKIFKSDCSYDNEKEKSEEKVVDFEKELSDLEKWMGDFSKSLNDLNQAMSERKCDVDSGIDIVFQRYGFPGLAHNMYWNDGELFKGILHQIIDKSSNSSIDLTREEFIDKPNAKKQSYLWAYFRIPYLVSLITALLLIYSLNSFFNDKQLAGALAFLLTLFLWYMPPFLTFYKKRTDVENVNKNIFIVLYKSFTERLFSKGLFTLLLNAGVQWRRLLVSQAEGRASDKEYRPVQNYDNRFAWWSFMWRWLWRFVFAAIAMKYWIEIVFSQQYFNVLDKKKGLDLLIEIGKSFFEGSESTHHIFHFTLFGDNFTNIAVFFMGLVLAIYLLVAIRVLILFFFWRWYITEKKSPKS